MNILNGSVKGVLFDLDDTLYDRRKAFDAWTVAFIRDRLRIHDPEEQRSITAWVESLDADGYGSKHGVMVALRGRYPDATGAVDTFYDEFIEHIKLDADSDAVLTELSLMGMPFGIVTNGSERQWQKIRALDLERRTSRILVSATFGAAKPDIAIFHAAANKLGVAAPNILFVGDNPVNDIHGAKNAGMQTAWLHRGQPWPADITAPDFTLDRLTDLLSTRFP